MKVLYLAGPYRSKNGLNGVYENIYAARKKSLELWKEGWAVICPHMNTAMMDEDNAHEMFLKGDLELIKRCDAIFMLPGWEESEGSCAEHELAQQLNLEIIYG